MIASGVSQTRRLRTLAMIAIGLLMLSFLIEIAESVLPRTIALMEIAHWAVGIPGGVLLLYVIFHYWKFEKEQEQAALQQKDRHMEALQRQMAALLQLNSELALVDSEKELLQAILRVMRELVGARGVSFLPVDDLGQPLPAISLGDITSQQSSEWNHHLTTEEVRQVCGNCQRLHAYQGQICPLMGHPYQGTQELVCLPVQLNHRRLGVLTLYLPKMDVIDAETKTFLYGVLNEMALAIEALRLKTQATNTLHQLQVQRSAEMDIETVLSALMDIARKSMGADFAILRLSENNLKVKPLSITCGEVNQAVLHEAGRILQMVLIQNAPVYQVEHAGRTIRGWAATPLRLGSQEAVGVMMAGSLGEPIVEPRQMVTLQMAAAQALMIVENERMLLDLEFRAVIGERTRLAREIHDGIAQTLAYLKMQSSQMINLLEQGDTERLSKTIYTSYQTFSEAYLDIRQAIDNLRLDPEETLDSWLPQTVRMYENLTGTQVEMDVMRVGRTMPLEVQVQLMRIIQEALSNIRKHAGANHVKIWMQRWEGDTVLEIRDNGKGFTGEEIPSGSQHGLKGMRERSEMIGADLQVISQEGAGTTVRLRLPGLVEEVAG